MKGGVLLVVDLVAGQGRRRMQVGEGSIRITDRAVCVRARVCACVCVLEKLSAALLRYGTALTLQGSIHSNQSK